MSRIIVPRARTIPAASEILAGEPVLAPSQWSDVANGALWLRGKGAQLVPMFNPGYEIKNASEHTFRFRVKTRSSAVQRVWTVLVTVEPAAGEPYRCHVLLKAPAATGTAVRGVAVAAEDGTTAIPPMATTIVETLGSRSNTEQEISVSVQCLTDITAGTMITTARVVGIACCEQDRPVLEDDTTDQAVRLETIRPGEPVLRTDNVSLWGAMQTLAEADARRVGLFHYSTAGVISRLSATPANLLSVAAKIQAPKLTRSTTTTSVKWNAYARSTTGASVTVAISTSSSGVSDSMAFTSTSFGWGTSRSVSIDCDDMSAADLFNDDELQVTIAGSGVASIEFYAVSVWVDDVT